MNPPNGPRQDLPLAARHRATAKNMVVSADSKGKAYVPLPQLKPQKPPRRGYGILTAIAAAAIVVGTGIAFQMADRHTPPPPPQIAAQTLQSHSSQILILSSKDLDFDATEQAKRALARGEIPPVLQNVSPETRQQIASGEQQLYTVRLVDFADEDGDTVSIAVNGVSFGELVLSNAGNLLTVPLRPSEQANLAFTAVRDGGGGGITFRAISSRGELRTRVMDVGEIESWTVVFQ